MRRLPNDNQKQDQHAKWGVANVHAKFNVAYNTNNGYLKKRDQIKLSSLLTSFFCVQNLEKVLHSGSLVQSYYSNICGSIGQVASLAAFTG